MSQDITPGLAIRSKGSLGKGHNANLAPIPIRDFKCPMLKAAFVPMAVLQHIARNHSGVFQRFFIAGKFIALRIGNRFPPAHNDIEKISWHSDRILEQSLVCGTETDGNRN
jgi:hypothetical protein